MLLEVEISLEVKGGEDNQDRSQHVPLTSVSAGILPNISIRNVWDLVSARRLDIRSFKNSTAIESGAGEKVEILWITLVASTLKLTSHFSLQNIWTAMNNVGALGRYSSDIVFNDVLFYVLWTDLQVYSSPFIHYIY